MSLLLSACVSDKVMEKNNEEKVSKIYNEGVLADYKKLKDSNGVIKIDEKVDLKDYDKILIKPVSFWAESPRYAYLNLKQSFIDKFYTDLHKNLDKCMSVSKTMDDKTLIVEVAFFDGEKDTVSMNNVSMVETASFKDYDPKYGYNLNGVNMEVKLTDANSGKMVAGGIKKIKGTNDNKMVSWDNVVKNVDKLSKVMAKSICSEINRKK